MLGPIVLVAGFLVAGEALLLGLNLVDSARTAFGAAGLALFSGWTITVLCLSLGLVVGVEPGLENAAVVWIAVVVTGAIAARRRRRRPPPWAPLREDHRAGRVLALLGVAVLAGNLLALLVRSWQPTGVLHPDVWNQWLAKAKALYYFGGLDTGPGGLTSQLNPDYPLLDPTSEALIFDILGGTQTLELARVHWVLAASWVGAVAWILAPRVRPAILWPSLAAFSLAPQFGSLVGSSLADEPLAFLIGLAGLTGLAWLLDDDPRFALLSGLFLAAAAATKNEGVVLALVVVVALALATRRRRHVPILAGLAGGVLAVAGIWRFWLSGHSVPRNPFYDFSDLLDLGYLLSRLDRLQYALGELLAELTTPSRWLLVVPATVVLALLAARRAPLISVFVLVVVALDVLAFGGVYWLSRVDLHFYVDNTVDRLPAFIAVFCGAILPLLLSVTAPAAPAGSDRTSRAGT